MTETDPTYRLTIEYDQDTESPNDAEPIGRMVSFNSRHSNYRHPDDIDQAEILATLAYYEHGLCRWSVGSSDVPDPGGWDTVTYAGAIMWNGTDDERSWWNVDLTDDDRARILSGIAEEYTAWSNGETYGYSLERLEVCDHGETHASDLIDSCWGFIGSGYMAEVLRDLLADYDIDPTDVEITGQAGHSYDSTDLAPRKVSA